ncbi:MAG TPA: DUF2505 family protein [bacterium]|nr:DUF2505 family protein [bacterium]
MKIRSNHVFGWDPGKIIDILKSGEDLYDMEDLPNVSMRKEVFQERKGSQIHRKYEWCVFGQIPKVAQRILRPEMLTFYEFTVWDDDKCSFDSRVEPHYFKDKVHVNSESTWSEAGENKTRRRIVTEVVVKIPVVGPVIEKTIAEHFQKNNNKSAEMVIKALTKRFGPESK